MLIVLFSHIVIITQIGGSKDVRYHQQEERILQVTAEVQGSRAGPERSSDLVSHNI